MLYYTWQANSQLVNTQYAYAAHLPIDRTHNTCVYDVTVFTNLCFCSIHRDDNRMVFHFKTCFQVSAFSGLQNAISV